MNAGDLLQTIKDQLAAQGINWRERTVDTIKAGTEQTEIRGIATTGQATFEQIKRAQAKGLNMVITHEPTWYNHLDMVDDLAGDPVYEAKHRFLQEHHMLVWRMHDHSHAMEPDPYVAGLARKLEWTDYQTDERRIFAIPEVSLKELANYVRDKLDGNPGMRVAGDPDMRVRRIHLGPGYGYWVPAQNFDVAIGGEKPESDGHAQYVMDATSIGQQKGIIAIGHIISEDDGNLELAQWLQGFLPDLPIEYVPAGDPFVAEKTVRL